MKNLIKSILILMPTLVSAQDVLFKTNNTKQEVLISEINSTTIKYKAFNNLNGPLYTIDKTQVALVVYQNGTHETFTKPVEAISHTAPSAPSRKTKRYLEVTENKNVIFLNTIEFLNSGVGVSYFREFGDGKFDLHIPFATSFKSPELDNGLSLLGASYGQRLTKTHYDIGLGLYYNTGGKRSVTHFIGPLIRNAEYSGNYHWSNYDYSNYQSGVATFKMNETSLMLNNGFLYRITPKFNMMLNFAVGTFIHRSVNYQGPTQNPYGSPFQRGVALHAGFHFGYRF